MFFFKLFIFWPFLLWTISFVSSFYPNSSILNLFLYFNTSNKKKKSKKELWQKRKQNIQIIEDKYVTE